MDEKHYCDKCRGEMLRELPMDGEVRNANFWCPRCLFRGEMKEALERLDGILRGEG